MRTVLTDHLRWLATNIEAMNQISAKYLKPVDIRYAEVVREAADILESSRVAHGVWLRVVEDDGTEYFKCSVCGERFENVYQSCTPVENYGYYHCYHCGARMSDEEKA